MDKEKELLLKYIDYLHDAISKWTDFDYKDFDEWKTGKMEGKRDD